MEDQTLFHAQTTARARLQLESDCLVKIYRNQPKEAAKSLQLSIALGYDEIGQLNKKRAVLRSRKGFSQVVRNSSDFEPVIRESYVEAADRLNKIERSTQRRTSNSSNNGGNNNINNETSHTQAEREVDGVNSQKKWTGFKKNFRGKKN
jgi:hypothetical protein